MGVEKEIEIAIRTIVAKLNEALENENETEGTEDSVIWHMVAGDYKLAISALERQMPKKPDFEMNLSDYKSRFICKCGKKIIVNHDSGVMNNHNAPNYCPNCGQALDWSD